MTREDWADAIPRFLRLLGVGVGFAVIVILFDETIQGIAEVKSIEPPATYHDLGVGGGLLD